MEIYVSRYNSQVHIWIHMALKPYKAGLPFPLYCQVARAAGNADIIPSRRAFKVRALEASFASNRPEVLIAEGQVGRATANPNSDPREKWHADGRLADTARDVNKSGA